MGVERRVFLGLTVLGGAGWGATSWLGWWTETAPLLPIRVRIADFDAAGDSLGVVEVASIRRTDAEWKAALPVDQYMVTRRSDTEFAFAGEYWNFHGDGLYRCVCCGTALFDSRMKFNSGTGWPSFTEPLAHENVVEIPDSSFGVARTAVRCRRCGGHLGHVFEDGGAAGERRYCMNSVALRFVPRKSLANS